MARLRGKRMCILQTCVRRWSGPSTENDVLMTASAHPAVVVKKVCVFGAVMHKYTGDRRMEVSLQIDHIGVWE